MDPLDYNLGDDVLIAPVDLGVIGEITVDDEALMRAGLSAAALVPDELGILYNVAGQWVEIPAEQYAAEVFAARGPGGGIEILGPDNVVLLTETEVANTANDTDLQTKTLQALSARSGLTAPSQAPPADRPAGLTAPASTTTVSVVTDFAKLAESLTSSFAKIVTTIRQVENGTYGRVPSPYGQTSPYGTLRPQQVGVPVRNVDGSVTVNNGNGTQTKTLPNGQQITTRTTPTTGGTFGGISTNTLLLAGAGLAALLLLRRK
jgi:hypothetical protein